MIQSTIGVVEALGSISTATLALDSLNMQGTEDVSPSPDVSDAFLSERGRGGASSLHTWSVPNGIRFRFEDPRFLTFDQLVLFARQHIADINRFFDRLVYGARFYVTEVGEVKWSPESTLFLSELEQRGEYALADQYRSALRERVTIAEYTPPRWTPIDWMPPYDLFIGFESEIKFAYPHGTEFVQFPTCSMRLPYAGSLLKVGGNIPIAELKIYMQDLLQYAELMLRPRLYYYQDLPPITFNDKERCFIEWLEKRHLIDIKSAFILFRQISESYDREVSRSQSMAWAHP